MSATIIYAETVDEIMQQNALFVDETKKWLRFVLLSSPTMHQVRLMEHTKLIDRAARNVFIGAFMTLPGKSKSMEKYLEYIRGRPQSYYDRVFGNALVAIRA
jgi:hypothetical protein